MHIKNVVLVLPIIFFSACIGISPEARSVEVYQFEKMLPDSCQKLGNVEAKGYGLSDETSAMSDAEDNLRQKAYDAYQANTLLVTELYNVFGGANYSAIAKGTAYNCK